MTLDLDDIVGRIECGETLTSVAESLGMPRSTLMHRIGQLDASARVEAARKVGAAAYAEKAETVISSAEDAFELAKAKELAHHYRWQASKANPATFGDRVQQDVTHNIKEGLAARLFEARNRVKGE